MGTTTAIVLGLLGFFLGLSTNGVISGILFGSLMFAMTYGAFVWRPGAQTLEALAPGVMITSQEQRLIASFTLTFMELGLKESDALEASSRIVTEVLAELKGLGVDPFKQTRGDELAANPEFTAPRLAEGLTAEDIRHHWNRPLVVVLSENKMREMLNFVYVDIARLQGRDTSVAAAEYRRTFPRYGDPRQWNPAENFNVGLRPEDADIFLEFANRVDSWRRRIGDVGAKKAVEEFGTLNAAIRSMASKGLLH
ncbi:hypothetical protein [Hydrogenophaga sp. 2FB]|uniref:hypothetical protein n=1 Tax=Hydrogenophaga sp. 2FB TaxID=2502187 RepID=UPI0010F762ED|nr:hypothetical protein [Hydrogenophaga sp. 2FB]